MWNGWIVWLAGYNAAVFCKQDMVQALDSESLKVFARQRIRGHKPTDSSEAAARIEHHDERCVNSNSFQAGERTGVQSKGKAECKGSISGTVKNQVWIIHMRRHPTVFHCCCSSLRADSLSSCEFNEKTGLAA